MSTKRLNRKEEVLLGIGALVGVGAATGVGLESPTVANAKDAGGFSVPSTLEIKGSGAQKNVGLGTQSRY